MSAAVRFVRRGAIALAFGLAGCGNRAEQSAPPAPSGSAKASSIAAPSALPEPRRGMIWIEPGALVAGTPPDVLPRLPDQEMPGEQLILKGFYIDTYPYPNEEGAIPLTNVTRDGAAKLCAEQQKRLCSELEWERACKGPSNTLFEYGNQHRPDRCGTGVPPSLKPSGLRVACRSEFGVRDLHGGAFEWTSSPWGRGTEPGFVALRGGNGVNGELIGRCAHAEPERPETSSPTIGFRCCAGEPNAAEVTLAVRRGSKLEPLLRVDRELSARLVQRLPDEAKKRLRRFGEPRVEQFWIWRPIGNEEIRAARVCSGLGKQPACGVLFARLGVGDIEVLGFADSGFFPATLHAERGSRELWMLGGDDPGPFKRHIEYSYGRITIGAIERRIPKSRKKKNEPRVPANRGTPDSGD